MSRFHGKMDNTGPKGKGRKNKGVLKAYRERQRIQAEVRQEDADPRKSKAARLRSTFNSATGRREPWDKFPMHQRNHETRVGVWLAKNPEEAAVNA